MGPRIIDADQHLFEARTTWVDHIDPGHRDDALMMTDDDRGWTWLTWRGQHLTPVDVQHPHNPEEIGELRRAMARGDQAPDRYEDALPRVYADAAARVAQLETWGIDAAVLFPNFGLVWEERLAVDPPARRANARAYNRWMAGTLSGHREQLFGVAHLVLDDPAWAVEEIHRLAAEGVRLAMIAPAPVNGHALSHPDLDPVWAAFCETNVAPVFHVAGFQSPLHPAWHEGDPEPGDQLLDSVFLWAAPAIALANMIYHGTLERFPELRIGVVELTAGWVPGFLVHLDGAFDFYAARHAEPFHTLALRPSEYFLRQVRVSALPYERPNQLVQAVGEDTFMVGSDWPHAEGVGAPRQAALDAIGGLTPAAQDKTLSVNASWLLGLTA